MDVQSDLGDKFSRLSVFRALAEDQFALRVGSLLTLDLGLRESP